MVHSIHCGLLLVTPVLLKQLWIILSISTIEERRLVILTLKDIPCACNETNRNAELFTNWFKYDSKLLCKTKRRVQNR